jgi:hypothetical protein
MFVVYGWLKEKRPVKPVFNCYCYVCQRAESWEVVRETEWVTFFGMRTIPFLTRDALACGRCADLIPLARTQALRLLRGDDTARSMALVEEFQLASKSEVQRNFLLSMRASREQDKSAA